MITKKSHILNLLQGSRVDFYDGKKKPVASVTSKYARYTKKTNIWELRDSVVVVNEGG